MVLQGRKVLRCPHNDCADFRRVIDLKLESGDTATLVFPTDFTDDWLQFGGSHRTLSTAQDKFAYVYRLLRADGPVFLLFFTGSNFVSIRVGAVHTKFDLSESASPAYVVWEARKLCRNSYGLPSNSTQVRSRPKLDLRKGVPNPK